MNFMENETTTIDVPAEVDWNNVDDFLILSKFTVLYGANQGRKRWSSIG